MVLVPKLGYRLAARIKKFQVTPSPSSARVWSSFVTLAVQPWGVVESSRRGSKPTLTHLFFFLIFRLCFWEVLQAALHVTAATFSMKLPGCCSFTAWKDHELPGPAPGAEGVTLRSVLHDTSLLPPFTKGLLSKRSRATWLWLKHHRHTETTFKGTLGHFEYQSFFLLRCHIVVNESVALQLTGNDFASNSIPY